LPSYLVADDLRAGRLVLVLPRERLLGFRAHAVLPSSRHVPRRVRVFVDVLAAPLRGTARISRSATPPPSS
jgi:DNA-binding transcriptional LysR family regulator